MAANRSCEGKAAILVVERKSRESFSIQPRSQFTRETPWERGRF